MVGAIEYIRAKRIVAVHCAANMCARCKHATECDNTTYNGETDAEHVERIMRWAKGFKEGQNG